jgi:peptide/nickel transport system permease protein
VRWRLLTRDPLAMVGLAVLIALAVSAAAAPWLAPYDPTDTSPREMLRPPSAEHLLGTDDLGRDVLSRLLYAGRVSLGLALAVASLSVTIGALLGGAAGLAGGRLDRGIGALVDTLLAVPQIGRASCRERV